MSVASLLEKEFCLLTGLKWEMSSEIARALGEVEASVNAPISSPSQRETALWTACGVKLSYYYKSYRDILDMAADVGLILNYHQKEAIRAAVDTSDSQSLQTVLASILLQFSQENQREELLRRLCCLYVPLDLPSRRAALHHALAAETPDRSQSISNSIFAMYAFACWPLKALQEFFSYRQSAAPPSRTKQEGSHTSTAPYQENFIDHLRQTIPHTFQRDFGLAYLRVDDDLLQNCADASEILEMLRESSHLLSNHCLLALHIKPLPETSSRWKENAQWLLAEQAKLYGEVFRHTQLKAGYFHPNKIAEHTSAYIPNLNASEAQFSWAPEGWHYKDCFTVFINRSDTKEPADLLLIWEKNERDETVIPCPACRSWLVRGNSYPILGVRSWECYNALCPERSKFNRGNRYSMASLLKQEAIEDDEAQIPLESLKNWKRDIARVESESEIRAMLSHHYSFPTDTVLVSPYNEAIRDDFSGRKVRDLNEARQNTGCIAPVSQDNIEINAKEVEKSPFFARFAIDKVKESTSAPHKFPVSHLKDTQIINADCFDFLKSLPDNHIDGIVTSPPYYNSREYSQWQNIYCYLFDIFNVIKQLARVAKPGAPVIWNIFDTFGNQNNVVLSAMGQKRLILSAYTVHMMRGCGFKLVANTIWDKGEIEGKRNFNSGNRSPYYQSPFNCWEHILIFSNGPANFDAENIPVLLRSAPVLKMVRGVNILGHSAPFPDSIPLLLLDILPKESLVLDPYGGSMTTVRVAQSNGYKSIGVDYSEEFCRLGIQILNKSMAQASSQQLALPMV